MTGEERRYAIVSLLKQSDRPVSGTALGEKFQASRQIIVQDIALLRASGFGISSTNRGYVLDTPGQVSRLIKVRHGIDELADEMNAIVDLGGCIIDVMVNHRTYGRIQAPLEIHNRREVKRFLADLEEGISSPLSALTDGYHFHTVSAESDEVLDEIVQALDELGLLAELTEYEKQAF